MNTSRREFFGQLAAAAVMAATPGAAHAGEKSGTAGGKGPVWIDGLSAVTLDAKGFDALTAAGITMISTTVGTAMGPADAPNFTYEAAVSDIAKWHGYFATYADHFIHVKRADDILRAQREGRTGVMINFQNATHLNRDIRNVKFFYDLGVRQIQLTYNDLNALGAGCTERDDVGLSHFGVAVIEKMNELGILVDVSHCGVKTTLDAIEISKKPIIFSHTNCRALADNPRCKTDDQIRKLVAKGGLIGLTTYGTYIKELPPVTLDDFIHHVEHAVKLVGIDHVGIGSDTPVQYLTPPTEKDYQAFMARSSNFKPVEGSHFGDQIEELNGPEKFRRIQKRLKERGFANTDIDKILGGNFLRIYREILG